MMAIYEPSHDEKEANFLRRDEDVVLEQDGLFAQKEWEKIAACCIAEVRPSSEVEFPVIIVNPNARHPVPRDVLVEIKSKAYHPARGGRREQCSYLNESILRRRRTAGAVGLIQNLYSP